MGSGFVVADGTRLEINARAVTLDILGINRTWHDSQT